MMAQCANFSGLIQKKLTIGNQIQEEQELLVDKFLKTNNINFIVRTHQLIMEGYRMHFNGKLFTVWSAPNYCYRCNNNMAAIMRLDASLKYEFDTFKASAEDYKPAPPKQELPEYFL